MEPENAGVPGLLPTLGRLPSGRHGLTREQVERSQLERLLVAMLRSTYELGYRTATVADVVRRAAVSRSTFYAHFADLEACFLAAYGYASDIALDPLRRADAGAVAGAWRAEVGSEISEYMNVLIVEPALAVTLHVEVLAAGARALDRRAEMLALLAGRIAALNALARREQPTLPEVPPAAFALYAGGLDELIRDRLRTGAAAALPDLIGPVVEATCALFGA